MLQTFFFKKKIETNESEVKSTTVKSKTAGRLALEPTLHSGGPRPLHAPRERCSDEATARATAHANMPSHLIRQACSARFLPSALRSPRVSSDHRPPTSIATTTTGAPVALVQRTQDRCSLCSCVPVGVPHRLSPRLHVAGHHLGAKRRPAWCLPLPARHLGPANRQRRPQVCDYRLPLELARPCHEPSCSCAHSHPLPCRCAP